jgi:HSP20 family protein
MNAGHIEGVIMNENVAKKSVGMTIGVGAVMLVFGVFLGVSGVAIAKRLAPGSPDASTTGISVASPNASAQSGSTVWNPFQEWQDMQARMDRMFQQSFDRLRASPTFDLFKDDAGYSLSLNVRDLKDRYEVQALLPDVKASDANVTLKGNQLEVSVTDNQAAQQSNSKSQVSTSAWGRYDESIHLAGNLDGAKMKVERRNHELLITIPKA